MSIYLHFTWGMYVCKSNKKVCDIKASPFINECSDLKDGNSSTSLSSAGCFGVLLEIPNLLDYNVNVLERFCFVSLPPC